MTKDERSVHAVDLRKKAQRALALSELDPFQRRTHGILCPRVRNGGFGFRFSGSEAAVTIPFPRTYLTTGNTYRSPCKNRAAHRQ